MNAPAETNIATNVDANVNVKEVVRQKYGEAARRVSRGAAGSCCGGGGTGSASAASALGQCDPITADLYDAAQAADVPAEAMLASLGCGNPTALAELRPGETVLDLGCGGGIDVLLSARRVGPTGMAFGLDMTDDMLALAEANKRKSGLTHVHFLKGEIEHIPLPPDSVDVIISNCVINLSADKDQVLREAFRVLKPGGRFAVSDVVLRGEVPELLRRNVELWIGCVAGALRDSDYPAKLQAAGFEDASIEITREYTVEDARDFLAGQPLDLQALDEQVDGKFASGFVRARKPMGAVGPVEGGAAAGAAAVTPKAAAPAAAGSASGDCGCAPSCCGGSRAMAFSQAPASR